MSRPARPRSQANTGELLLAGHDRGSGPYEQRAAGLGSVGAVWSYSGRTCSLGLAFCAERAIFSECNQSEPHCNRNR
jgi:hypothetical protein